MLLHKDGQGHLVDWPKTLIPFFCYSTIHDRQLLYRLDETKDGLGHEEVIFESSPSVRSTELLLLLDLVFVVGHARF